MGYRGKVVEQERARELRAEGKTLLEIATELGVSKSSVSLWVRDVVFTPKPRQRPMFAAPSRLHLAKLAEIEEMNRRGCRAQVGTLSATRHSSPPASPCTQAREPKADGDVIFANTDAGDDRLLLRLAAPVLRSRRAPAPGPRCISTTASISTRRRTLVVGDRAYPGVQFGKPYRAVGRSEHSSEQARVRLRLRATTAVRRLTGRSWGSMRALLSSEVLPG